MSKITGGLTKTSPRWSLQTQQGYLSTSSPSRHWVPLGSLSTINETVVFHRLVRRLSNTTTAEGYLGLSFFLAFPRSMSSGCFPGQRESVPQVANLFLSLMLLHAFLIQYVGILQTNTRKTSCALTIHCQSRCNSSASPSDCSRRRSQERVCLLHPTKTLL